MSLQEKYDLLIEQLKGKVPIKCLGCIMEKRPKSKYNDPIEPTIVFEPLIDCLLNTIWQWLEKKS